MSNDFQSSYVTYHYLRWRLPRGPPGGGLGGRPGHPRRLRLIAAGGRTEDGSWRTSAAAGEDDRRLGGGASPEDEDELVRRTSEDKDAADRAPECLSFSARPPGPKLPCPSRRAAVRFR